MSSTNIIHRNAAVVPTINSLAHETKYS
jgi:hypothetical protein